jgi:L,D-transpeptidase YcbB
MKNTSTYMFKFVLPLIFPILMSIDAQSEPVPNSKFKAFVENISGSSAVKKLSVHQYKMLYAFYTQNSFSVKWFANVSDSINRNSLQYLLAHADIFALRPEDFHFAFISLKQNYKTTEDTFASEVMYTDAALSFMHDLAYGGDYQFVKYNGLKYHPDHLDLISTLNEAFNKPNFKSYLTFVEPRGDKFNCLKEEYLRLLMLLKSKDFDEIYVSNKEIKTSNINLVNKLRQLGYLDHSDTTEEGLKAGLEKLQRQNNLLVQNSINIYCLEVLNETIAHKLEELIWNIKWYRWLNGMKDKSFVVVNIPSNRLIYYENGTAKLESKMVVGKISTPTPTLTSEIKNVIYYPYWNVPHSITVNEMLPILKTFPGYLQKLKLQVLQNGRVVSAVNWHAYSPSNFPFQLRQTPGCHNALGLLKFEFENPFHVYLHDTNAKFAFMANKRFFSHGCMRIEKPFELAVALGVDPKRIDMTKCLENKKPEVIQLPKAVPVFVTYATVDVIDGKLKWNEDAYNRIKKGLPPD